MKVGCDAWYSIGSELGFNRAQINVATASLPNHPDRLLAIIQEKAMDIGKSATVEKLLEVCKILPTPIHGQVMDELKRSSVKCDILCCTTTGARC